MVKNPFEIEEEENADAEEEMDDDGSSSGGSDVSRKGNNAPLPLLSFIKFWSYDFKMFIL